MANSEVSRIDKTIALSPLQQRVQQIAAQFCSKKTKIEDRVRIPGAPLPPDVRLPLWPQATRGVPNCILRSALFSISENGPRQALHSAKIETPNGTEMYFSGEQLDQGDLDVWLAILHTLRMEALGDQHRRCASQILKTLGKADTGGNRKVLTSRLNRLASAHVCVQVDKHGFKGNLLDGVIKDATTKEWIFCLNPQLLAIFSHDQFTQIQWEIREELSGKPLAQWLFGYYSSHAKPYPVKIQTLLKMSGSKNNNITSGRQMLRKALNELVAASTKFDHLFQFSVKDDLVFVKKSGSAAQQRHLAKNRKTQKKRFSR